MRSGIVGSVIGLSVAGSVFGTLFYGSVPHFEPPTPTTPPTSLIFTTPADYHTVCNNPEQEPRRLPVRFDEPPLATGKATSQRVIPAGFTSPVEELLEQAPLPRRQMEDGKVPLIEQGDLF